MGGGGPRLSTGCSGGRWLEGREDCGWSGSSTRDPEVGWVVLPVPSVGRGKVEDSGGKKTTGPPSWERLRSRIGGDGEGELEEES